jgi:hypothetical protein
VSAPAVLQLAATQVMRLPFTTIVPFSITLR